MRRRIVDSNSSPLAEAVVTGNWEKVVEIYLGNPHLHAARITISGETALHMAATDGREETVVQLVEIMKHDEAQTRKALTAVNERGNTPLHLAAAMGSAPMCRCIAEVNPGLLSFRRNHDGETPVFLAVFHGMKDAFLYLYSVCAMVLGERPHYSLGGRKDGNTILHSAIAGGYLDLAIIITHMYPELVDTFNQDGFSPLHLLATKPSIFRSGSSITGFSRLVYDCTFVDELKPHNFTEQLPFLQEHSGNGIQDPSQRLDVEDPNNIDHLHHKELNRGSATNWFEAIKVLSNAMLFVTLHVLSFGLGSREIGRIKERKQKHIWSVQVLDALLQHTSSYKVPGDDGSRPPESLPFEDGIMPPYDDLLVDDDVIPNLPRENEGNLVDEKTPDSVARDSIPTPLLIAAKNGVTEIVEKHLLRFPRSIFERDGERKNIVLLAVENRQPQVYQFVLNLKTLKDTLFRQVDEAGNSVLHLAAKLGDQRTWLNHDTALHMQREIKWFQYVRNSMPVGSNARLNKEGKTAQEIFIATHQHLATVSAEWFVHVSESCSFVAALVATVAFATAATIPGGVKQDIGTPALKDEPLFYVFAISSLVALCFSVTSTVIFLAILTSGFQIKDFHTSLPRKLLTGLAALCVSIIAMMFSFCASHFFILKDKLSYGAFGLYAAMALMPVVMTFLLISRFPHSLDLMWATLTNLPQVIPLPERTDDVLLP